MENLFYIVVAVPCDEIPADTGIEDEKSIFINLGGDS